MTDEPIKNDFYLKLPNEAAMPTALSAFYRNDGEGNPYLPQAGPGFAIDVVGVIHKMVDDVMTPLDGWHVNIRIIGDAYRDTVEALDATYGVTPTTPARVWL